MKDRRLDDTIRGIREICNAQKEDREFSESGLEIAEWLEELRNCRRLLEILSNAFPAGDYHLDKRQNTAINAIKDYCFEKGRKPHGRKQKGFRTGY